jgi:hypothetical protein
MSAWLRIVRCARALVLPLSILGTVSAQSVIFDYSNVGKATIMFTPSSDVVDLPNGVDADGFQLADLGSWGLGGMVGQVSGTFTISPYFDAVSGQLEPASSGTGTLSVYGSNSGDLLAKLTAEGVSPIQMPNIFNPAGLTDLNEFSFQGSYASLLTLVNSTTGTETLAFQFIPGNTLPRLANGGPFSSTTFFGSLVSIPELPVSGIVLGSCALAFAMMARRRGISTG